MPPSSSVWTGNPGLNDGLPGIVSDSLPDGWGRLLLARQLKAAGRLPESVTALENLLLTGSSGMGALEYEPSEKTGLPDFPEIALDSLAEDADSILKDSASAEALDRLWRLNGSSGGARPKIVCLVSDGGKHLKRGTDCEEGFSPWLIKFGSSEDPADTGIQEYIAAELAHRAGIAVPPVRLFPSERGPGWFGVQRFDRTPAGKLHMATAAGLLDCSFRLPVLDYRNILALTLQLCGRAAAAEQLRRCAFNFAIGNSDDHAKNFSFLMNAAGDWSVSPAYDLVPAVYQTEHMTSVLGAGKNPDRETFRSLGKMFGILKAETDRILEEVSEAVSGYSELARQYGVKVPKSVHPEFR